MRLYPLEWAVWLLAGAAWITSMIVSIPLIGAVFPDYVSCSAYDYATGDVIDNPDPAGCVSDPTAVQWIGKNAPLILAFVILCILATLGGAICAAIRSSKENA